jgi:hypothetical protein
VAWITAGAWNQGEEEGGAALGAAGRVAGMVGEGGVAVETEIAAGPGAVEAVLVADGADFGGGEVVVLLALGAHVGGVSLGALGVTEVQPTPAVRVSQGWHLSWQVPTGPERAQRLEAQSTMEVGEASSEKRLVGTAGPQLPVTGS